MEELVHLKDQNVTGRKRNSREGENTNSRIEGQDRGRFGQTIDVRRNRQERTRWIQKETLSGGETGKLEGGWIGV